MPNPLLIDADLLRSKGACEEEVTLLEKQWPSGIVPTARIVGPVVRLGLDVEWAASKLLSHPEDFERQRDPIWAEYERQRDPLWAEYERQYATIWTEYERQRDPLWAEYQRQCARLFIAAWRQQNGREGMP